MVIPESRATDQEEDIIMPRCVMCKTKCGEYPEDEQDLRAFYLQTRELFLYLH